MDPSETTSLEPGEAYAPVWVLLVGLLLIILAIPTVLWLRDVPPVWDAATPPRSIHFCGRDYRNPQRLAQPLPVDPTAVEPTVDAVDGKRLAFPVVQTTRFNGSDVCSTVLQIHDAAGWVAYSLVGGP
jgi:hypothetical protein